MKIEKLINIKLNENEMREAVLDYFKKYKELKEYYKHLSNNNFLIDTVGDYFVICTDGVFNTERIGTDVEEEIAYNRGFYEDADDE